MAQKDWRKQSFLDKFQAAATELNATSYRDIESVKFRDSTNFQDYQELLRELSSLNVTEIKGEYQGRAWKLTDTDSNSIIIVEHETGLEILYIVGSVASIISLVPLTINVWNKLHDHWPPFRGRFGSHRMERRRFDRKDNLVEEPTPPVETIMLQHLLSQNDKLNERVSSLESEISKLKNRAASKPRSTPKKKRKKSQAKKE